MSKKTIFKVSFVNQETVYEIYAGQVCESDMFGFIEISHFLFDENTSMVVDPSEERLKAEFGGVERCYIPMHSVLKIDEVVKQGISKVKDSKTTMSNISQLPLTKLRRLTDSEK